MTARLRDGDLAAAICALLEVGQIEIAKRFAEEIHARLLDTAPATTSPAPAPPPPPATRGGDRQLDLFGLGRTSIGVAEPWTDVRERTSAELASTVPSEVQHSSSSDLDLPSKEKKTAGRWSLCTDSPLEHAYRKIYDRVAAARAAVVLPPVELVWDDFVDYIAGTGRTYKTEDLLKRRWRKWCRFERPLEAAVEPPPASTIRPIVRVPDARATSRMFAEHDRWAAERTAPPADFLAIAVGGAARGPPVVAPSGA